MSTKYFKLWGPGIERLLPTKLLTAVVMLLVGVSLHASPTATTLAGGKPSKYYGYADGTTLESLFHTPCGMTIDSTGNFLYIADRDNNALRMVDFQDGLTWTVTTNLMSNPVAVQVDSSGDFYVLNSNKGNNGYVISFDGFGNILATNVTGLTNPVAMTRDLNGNLYVTANSNAIVKITPSGTVSNLLRIPYLGSDLSGITYRADGHLAVCDAGLNGVYDIDPTITTNNVTNNITLLAGFNGPGDFITNGNNYTSATLAKFRNPMSIVEAGDGSLIVADYGNNRLKVISGNVVTNLEGITEKYWHGQFKGWQDGPVTPPDSNTANAESRKPFGLAFGPDGTVYMSEDYYHTIRKVTGATFGLPPPPPPQLTAPKIGYVTFVLNADSQYVSFFTQVTNTLIFNNPVSLVIVGETGSETFYNYSNTPTVGLVPNPTATSGEVQSGYEDGLFPSEVAPYIVAGVAPYVSIKAISESNDGAPNSPIASATFEFITGNPQIQGENAASFTVSEITSNALLYYTTDGSNPSNSVTVMTQGFSFNTNTLTYTAAMHFSSNNFPFQAFAATSGFQNSQTVSNYFSAANFQPNQMSFGTTNGELSSTFVARPGQFYYVPVTLQLQPGGETLFSLQFNLTVTNSSTTTAQIANDSGFNFFTMLMSQVPAAEGDHYPPNNLNWYLEIPPVFGDSLDSTLFTNSTENLLGVDWSFRIGLHYDFIDVPGEPNIDFNTGSQDLISYSIAHDDLFQKAGGVVILGAYSFNVPTNATLGNTYSVQIGSPSGTRDGVGAPGNDVYIQAPATPQLITVGTPSYLVGDVAPFRWLNAGDFGDNTLDNADVEQVYQYAVEGLDLPPANSDLFAAMDSSGTFGAYDSVHGYYTNTIGAPFPNFASMMNGDDTTINTNCFGDGFVDVADLYVTYRRSLDPSLTWFRRFWTNGQFVAVSTPNLAYNSNNPAVLAHVQPKAKSKSLTEPNASEAAIVFNAGDAQTSAGKTVHIPVTANVIGGYPLTVVGLNVSVEALNGAPTITNQVSFAPGTGLGAPTMASELYPANYCAAWLSNSIAGLTGTNALIGTLTFTVPATATTSSAYSIHFNAASGSPNGQASFPSSKYTGLVTLSSGWTNSSYGDGIPDSWRLRWFGTVNNVLSESNGIPAGDGITSWQKYVAGVDPTIPNNFPALHDVTPVPTGYKAIHWPSVYGKHYVILKSSNLFSPGWSLLSTNTGTGGDMEYDDSTSSGNNQFYRVLIQQN